jgi:hypothetical protein
LTISTYAELQTAVGNWLDRQDLSSRIVEFISMWEAKVNRRLRVRQMMATTTLTPSNGSASLPADYLEWRRVTWTGSIRRELEYVEPTYMQAAYPMRPTDIPRFFTIEDGTLKIMPLDTTGLEFLYYQQVPVLSGGNPTNWLLAVAPDAYLFGALTEASGFTEDITAGPIWNARADEALADIVRLSAASRGQAMIRAYGATP